MISNMSWCCIRAVRTLLAAQKSVVGVQKSVVGGQKSVIGAGRHFSGSSVVGNNKAANQPGYKDKEDQVNDKGSSVEASFKTDFRALTDATAEVVYDVIEEAQREDEEVATLPEDDPFAGYNLKRGSTGVFDIEELPGVLRRERAKDICVLELPYEQYHVRHMVIVTVRSKLHLWALQEFLRKLYKRKMAPGDTVPFVDKKVAGKGSKGNINWISLNLGNVIVHLMLADIREYYDMESLWAVGPEFDELMQVREEKYSNLLHQLMSVDDFKPNKNINL